ncbi:esterase-like activity of phytase family protein [Sulfitobacter noctilucicola]|uniref:esterase-like activity of phytase family protein n=1 Tax=Sulfitobacter noctilucicola TaxID=1342301 RepID=UPI001363DA1F|nr:esterase-like activity of phytase family protein [Sulfitobacter noctilucicola]
MAEPSVQLLSKTTWVEQADWFGGFSGIEVSSDGLSLTLLSDRGTLVRAKITRTGGLIDAVKAVSNMTLSQADGTALKRTDRDSEGLAVLADGTAFISLEHNHRVAKVDLDTARLSDIEKHPDFAGFALNRGLEPLAAHPDGTLYTLAEGGVEHPDGIAVYVLRDSAWTIAHRIPASRPFQPVGADFDEKGRLYLLERTVSPLGFRTQIRRFDFDAETLQEETLITSFPAAFDNLEGLTLWTDSNGMTRLILLSDDNFFRLQTTQIIEFAVTR